MRTWCQVLFSGVVVVLPDPFREMRAWRNSTETQQSGHGPRSGPKVKNGRSSAKDGAPERLRCGTVKEEASHILQRMSARTASTFRRLNVVVRSPPLFREVSRNGETTTPRGPTIRSSPIVWFYLVAQEGITCCATAVTLRPHPFIGIGVWSNSMKNQHQQLYHAARFVPQAKDKT